MKASGIKVCVLFIKYIPIISAMILMLYVSSLIHGRHTENKSMIIENTVTMSIVPTVGTLIISKNLGFCKLHRCFIVYTYAVTTCIVYEGAIGFGVWLTPMRYLMLTIGILLFICLGFHIKKHKIKIFK